MGVTDLFGKKITTNGDNIIDIFNDPKAPLDWLDSATGLIWEVKNPQNYDNRYTFDEAFEYAKSLNRKYYNYSGSWRVPTINELMTLGSANLLIIEKIFRFQTRQHWKEKLMVQRMANFSLKNLFQVL